MVGVPGKYKGCETCRLRRVKCDNQRPFCRKCIDGGRECAGYERETVFIIGTIEDQGRCSSHPPRVVKPKKGKGAPKAAGAGSGEDERFELTAKEPLRPAWDDLISVSSRGKSYRLQIAALHTNLQAVTRAAADDDGDRAGDGKPVFLSLPPYEPPGIQSGLGEGEFRLSSQCLVHLATSDEEEGAGTGSATESICLFLYEFNNSSYFSTQPHWKDTSAHLDAVRRMGPEHFRSFPNHHFFVRVYRPSAIFTALLSRTPTFLAEPQWLSTPFESHGKCPLDHLLDILVLLPSLFARTDRVLAHEHTLARRLMAQDLLNNCLDVEAQLGRWFASLQGQGQGSSSSLPTSSATPPPSSSSSLLLGVSNLNATPSSSSASTVAFPFPEVLQSPQGGGGGGGGGNDRLTALALTYYYTSLVLFYPGIWRLYFAAVLEPVQVQVQDHHTHHTHHSSSPSSLVVPPRFQTLDPMRYSLSRTRECAGHVCRGLAYLLSDDESGGSGSAVQPDLLWHPFSVVRRFYEEEEMVAVGGCGGGGSVNVMQLGIGGMGMGMGMGMNMDMDMDMDMNMDMSMSMNMNMPMGMGGMDTTGLGGLGMHHHQHHHLHQQHQQQQSHQGDPGNLAYGFGGHGHGGGGGLEQQGLGYTGFLGGGGPGGGTMQQVQAQGQAHGGMPMMVGDGRLELMWCEGFRERLLARGREIREVVQGRMWVDLASF